MKISDLKEGMTINLDAGFTCVKEGEQKVFLDNHGFYFECNSGRHYLDGQEDENGNLVGVSQ